jgi:hypothetical protein
MIDNYIHKLMENLPENIKNRKKPLKIDLVLSGGAFNGSYILGALYFLKELEREKYIIIKRISTCSVSSFLGLLYLTDNLNYANELYFKIIEDFKNKYNLSKIFELKDMFKNINDETCSTLNNKLYISYNNIITRKKNVANKYKNTDYLFDVITRSCYIPFMIDYQPCYKNKYIDGINPYIFKSNKNTNKRIYIDVCTLDKLQYAFNIKNEKNNYHRLYEGLLDIHMFFVKQTNTNMCSDLDNWSIRNYMYYCIYLLVEKFSVFYISIIVKLKSIFLKNDYNEVKIILEKYIKMFLVNFCF